MELIIGVAVGVAVGDILVHFLGTGPWQLALVVTVAILLTIFAGGSVAIVIQAAATAVLIVTLSPTVEPWRSPGSSTRSSAVASRCWSPRSCCRSTRCGCSTGPPGRAGPARRPARRRRRRAAQPGPGGIQTALDRLRDNKAELATLTEAIEGAKETALLSPARWHRRSELTHYAEAADPIDRTMRNSGTLIRRAVTLIEDAEPVPEPMPDAVAHLAEAVRLLKREFAQGEEPERARERSLRAVSDAGRAYAEGVGFSGSVVVAQVRTTASDLMVASGISQEEANRWSARSFGEQDRPGGARPSREAKHPPRRRSAERGARRPQP